MSLVCGALKIGRAWLISCPMLGKADWMGREALTTLEIQAYAGLLSDVVDEHALANVWCSMPKQVQRYPDIVFVYAQKLMVFDQLCMEGAGIESEFR